jgi:hypothetical protein
MARRKHHRTHGRRHLRGLKESFTGLLKGDSMNVVLGGAAGVGLIALTKYGLSKWDGAPQFLKDYLPLVSGVAGIALLSVGASKVGLASRAHGLEAGIAAATIAVALPPLLTGVGVPGFAGMGVLMDDGYAGYVNRGRASNYGVLVNDVPGMSGYVARQIPGYADLPHMAGLAASAMSSEEEAGID